MSDFFEPNEVNTFVINGEKTDRPGYSVAHLIQMIEAILVDRTYDEIFTIGEFFGKDTHLEVNESFQAFEEALEQLDTAVLGFATAIVDVMLTAGYCTDEFVEWCEDADFWKTNPRAKDRFFASHSNGFAI